MMLAQAESARKVEKTLSLERILEEKGQSVLDKHLKRQEQLRAKNETAMARAKAKVAKVKPEMATAPPPEVVGAYPILSTTTMDGVKPLKKSETWPKNASSKLSRRPLRRLLLAVAGALYQPRCERRLWI